MCKRIGTIAVLVLLFGAAPARSQELWVGKDGNIRNVEARALVADEGGLYLATKKEIYRANDSKERWEPIFALPSGENEIRCLAGRSRRIFVGTKRGLFRSEDYGKTWRNVFRTILPEKNNILCIEMSRYNPKKIVMGTEKGIFVSEDLGGKWEDISGALKNRAVRCLALNKEAIYAGGDDGLYTRRDETGGWERLYVLSAVERSGEGPTADSGSLEAEDGAAINCIALKDLTLYAGAGRKILYSEDGGKGWKGFSTSGLGGTVNHIRAAQKSGRLYAATTKGVFEFNQEKGRWLELYKGMDKAFNVNDIVFDGEDERSLWALADKGLYRLEGGRYLADQYIDVERNQKSFKIIFDNEPAFKELQKAALRYAELDPEKIENWRTQARLRALLPKISCGWDKNRSSTAEIYTSATKDYIVTGPDDLTDGFDVSISWDLGDILWSDDQTNIDVRSRLNTQLRNDVLDDLRRAYYERKRLQFELMQSPPKDPKARFEKELRIQELAQAIDDLTGNYLSEHSKNSS